jgi:predicted DNA-binding protein with PD1-like motif
MRFIVLLMVLTGCSSPARYLRSDEMAPSGSAPKANSRQIDARENGTKDYVIVLHDGDELATALQDFATREALVAARFIGIGAVRGAQVGWFDVARKAYRVNDIPEQTEIISLLGDIGVDDTGKPIVHAHCALGDQSARASGGHLVRATTSPNVEIFLTTFPEPLVKRRDPDFDAQFFDLGGPR